MSQQNAAQEALDIDWNQPVYAEQFEVVQPVQSTAGNSSRPEDSHGHREYSTATAQHIASIEQAYNTSYHSLNLIQQRYLKTAQNYHILHRQYSELYQDSRHDKKKLELQNQLILELESVIEVYRTGYLSIPSGSNHGASTSRVSEAMPGPSAPPTTTLRQPRTPMTMPGPVAYKSGGPMETGTVQNDPGYLATVGSGYVQGPISSIEGASSPPKSPAKHKSNAGISKRGRKNVKQRQQSLELLATSQMAATE